MNLNEKNKVLEHIEEYVLGVASPKITALVEKYAAEDQEVHSALIRTQDEFNSVLSLFQATPKSDYLPQVQAKLKYADIQFIDGKLTGFIDLNENKQVDFWLELLNPVLGMKNFQSPIHINRIFKSKTQSLSLIFTNQNIIEEGHIGEQESILVLEGTCQGRIENDFFDLQPGDFWKVPQNKEHELLIDSRKPVTLLVMQVAA